MRARTAVALSLFLAVPLFAAQADMGVYGSGGAESIVVDPGGRFSLSVTVYSKGPDPAPNARLTISLPEGATLVETYSQFGSCRQEGSTIICDAPTPFGGFSAATTFTIEASPSFSGSVHTLTAHVSSEATDPGPQNNSWSRKMTTRRFLMVETDGDDGAGSLRQTIQTMNATCGGELPCKIIFARDMTIEPLTPLPAVTACNTGFDAGGAADAPLRVELRGTKTKSGSGLEVRTACRGTSGPVDGVTIHRLAIGAFPENGVNIVTTGQLSAYGWPSVRHVIEQCYIGTDNTGTTARPNGWRGIATDAADASVTIAFNTIAGNARSGIAFWRVGSANVFKNRIGMGADGRPIPNGASGLFAAAGSVGAYENEIAWNAQFGISTAGAALVTSQNSIHDNGELPIDLGLDGPSRTGALRPPVLTDAFYDAAADRTVIRGYLSGNNDQSPGGSFRIAFAVSNGRNARGFADAGTNLPAATWIYPVHRGDFVSDFEVTAKGDFRGRMVVGSTSYALWPDLLPVASSELSDGIIVH